MRDLLELPRTVVAGVLGAGTAMRGRRVFHPRGAAFSRRLVTDGAPGALGARLLDAPATHDGVVRVSRGLGLPPALPDVEGLAVRLPGLGVGGLPLDLLVNSAWRFTFAPSALSGTWSSILPYRTGTGRQVLLGARPQDGGFALLVAPPLGRWSTWGRLELGGPVPGEQLRFAPTVGAGDLVPVALLRTLRARSYDASQAARS